MEQSIGGIWARGIGRLFTKALFDKIKKINLYLQGSFTKVMLFIYDTNIFVPATSIATTYYEAHHSSKFSCLIIFQHP